MTMDDTEPSADAGDLQEARTWRRDGWTAQVIKNEEDDGWAVSMTQAGRDEPALVGPWTMGRDKKNPKPLDAAAFSTLVKTASEVLRRHEQQLHATLHREVTVEAMTDVGETRIRVAMDITPDDDNPSAVLSATDAASGEELGRVGVSPGFRLNRASALAWIEGGYLKPR